MGQPIHVGSPNGQTMQSSKPCLLYLSYLSDKEFEGHILPRSHTFHLNRLKSSVVMDA